MRLGKQLGCPVVLFWNVSEGGLAVREQAELVKLVKMAASQTENKQNQSTELSIS